MSAVTLAFCGDTTLQTSEPLMYPFELVEPLIKSADIAFCNLETSFGITGHRASKRHVINADPQTVAHLTRCGFDVVNVANNHVLDMGTKGGIKAIDILRANGIGVIGLSDGERTIPLTVTKNGIKLAFLGYADYVPRSIFMPTIPEIIIEDVKHLKQDADFVIVSLHWGYEYVDYPLRKQQHLARRIIDEGAHLVIGHHPHVVQGLEKYKSGLIAYSLGNFQFRLDQAQQLRDANSGFVLIVSLDNGPDFTFSCVPVTTRENGQVRLLDGDHRRREVDKLSRLSKDLADDRVGTLFWLKQACHLYFPQQLEAWGYRIRHYGWAELIKMIRWLLDPLPLALMLLYVARTLVFRIQRIVKDAHFVTIHWWESRSGKNGHWYK